MPKRTRLASPPGPMLCALLLSFLTTAPSDASAQARPSITHKTMVNPPTTYDLDGELPILCRFDFAYEAGNADAHFAKIQLVPEWVTVAPGEARFQWRFDLRDRDRGENVFAPYMGWYDARTWPFFDEYSEHSPSFHYVETEEPCYESCRLDLVEIPEGAGFYLSGFEFEFDGDEDHHVERIAVIPHLASSEVEVVLHDDSGDERPFTARVAYTIANKPSYSVDLVSESGADEYATVRREVGLGRGARALQGFDARFMNGDHHFGRLGVDICWTALDNFDGEFERYRGDTLLGIFQDKDGPDDPYRLDIYFMDVYTSFDD